MIYAHQWLPIPAVVGALFLLCAPWLALIALVVLLLVAVASLAALGVAIVADLRALNRSLHWATGKLHQSAVSRGDAALSQAQLTTRSSESLSSVAPR
jgi:hypothetical protein